METLPEILSAWRAAKGISQEEAADLCPRVTRSAWAMAERGERVRLRESTLLGLSAGTGIAIERIRTAAKRAEIAKLQRQLVQV